MTPSLLGEAIPELLRAMALLYIETFFRDGSM